VTTVIGITGPIGCGKSTVAGWLGELGAVVIDADRVARDVTGLGQPAVAAIAEAFGAGLVGPDGSLDRSALGRIVFADPDALARLEAIVHPAVRPRILANIDDAMRDGAAAVVVEAIKLVEGGLAEVCDEVWLISCDPTAQRARLIARGADPADADARMAAQSGLVDRPLQAATRTIDTSGPRALARERVTNAMREALDRAAP
jgi:dephospho-CoA kinase